MNIIPQTVEITSSISFTLNTLNDNHITNDNPILKILKVQLNEAVPMKTLIFSGAEYDALGQWTDVSLNEYIINKYGLTKISSYMSGSI
jgi:hypothetical protein